MAKKFLNQTNVSLSMAVWLAEDTYDHSEDPQHISATSLLKPTKQLCLGSKMALNASLTDVASLVASKMGTAIHDSIERAWLNNYKTSLQDLGYPNNVIERVLINPDPKDLTEDTIPVYMEQRVNKVVDGYNISGKFDFVIEGRLEDFKSTGTFTYLKKTNDEKYIMQGSIYRWLNPEIITNDHMAIQFIFTDWQAMRANTDKNYPKNRVMEYVLPLKSVEATEAFVRNKLAEVTSNMNKNQDDMPPCTDEELWRSAPVWKYYKSGKITARSTKNFDDIVQANIQLSNDGNSGIVVEVKGEVKACRYCPAASICNQASAYIADGTLKL
jgi:hypothetical protein